MRHFFRLFSLLATLFFFGFSDARETGTRVSKRRDVIAAVSQNPIASCLRNTKVVPGTTKSIATTLQELCKKNRRPEPDQYHNWKANYSVSKRNHRIEIDRQVYFRYAGDPKNRSEVIARVNRAKNCIENFYRRAGLYLTLTFNFNDDISAVREHDKKNRSNPFITLWDKSSGSTNTANYNVLQEEAFPVDADTLCSSMTHEVGHSLGLADAYREPTCPDRPILEGASSNLMVSGGMSKPQDMSLNPSQIRQIIAPLCGDQ